MEYLLCEKCHVFKRQIKEKNTVRKCLCEIRRNKVFKAATLRADREPLFLTGLLYSSVQKGHETNAKQVNGDYLLGDTFLPNWTH